jgi:hypothetical protein
MTMKVIPMATTIGLVSTLIFVTTLHVQFVFADPLIGSPLTPDFDIQSGNSSGYIVCDPNCHISSNSGGSIGGSSISDAKPAYRLTVNIPSHPFGTSTVDISITTANGHTDQANVPTASGISYTFNIPENQGKSIKVCVKPGNLSVSNCRTYETTGSDMSVSLPAVSSTSSGINYHHIGPRSAGGEYGAYFPGYNGFYGYP